MTDPPFKVGDRVRMKRAFRAGVKMKSFEGVVTSAPPRPIESRFAMYYEFRVRRDDLSPKTPPLLVVWLLHDELQWERVPLVDWASDAVARGLAAAVLAGDLTAALPLADRVFELCGGTAR